MSCLSGALIGCRQLTHYRVCICLIHMYILYSQQREDSGTLVVYTNMFPSTCTQMESGHTGNNGQGHAGSNDNVMQELHSREVEVVAPI